jgi:Tfp pilus assembly protein PilN
MRHEINLLRDAPAAATEGLSLTVAALAPALCLVLFLAASGILGVRASHLEQRISGLEAEALERKAHSSAQDVDLANIEQRLAAHTAALNALKNSGAGDQSGFGESLRALARSTIEGVWLTGITLEHGMTALHGRATAPPRVSAYLDSLQSQPLFGGRSFKALEIKLAKDKDAPATNPPAAAPGLEFQLVSQPDPGSVAPSSAAAGGSATAGRSAP